MLLASSLLADSAADEKVKINRLFGNDLSAGQNCHQDKSVWSELCATKISILSSSLLAVSA